MFLSQYIAFGQSNLFAQYDELLFVSQKHQSFLRPFLSLCYGTSPVSLYSLTRLTHFITFCFGDNNDMWHVLLPSSNYLRYKWPERHPSAPALWPSPASPYPSTSITHDSSFFHGVTWPWPTSLFSGPDGPRLCPSMNFSRRLLSVCFFTICVMYLKVFFLNATNPQLMQYRQKSFTQGFIYILYLL